MRENDPHEAFHAEAEAEAEVEINSLRARLAELEAKVQVIPALEAELASLRSAEGELRAIFRAMRDVVIVLNREGRYLKIAPTAPDLLYRPSEELLGKTLHEVFPKEVADLFLGWVLAALDQHCEQNVEYSLPVGDRLVWFAGTVLPMNEDSAVFVARDVTEQKRVEEALHDSIRHEEQLRAQAAALAELSTPLIPINKDVVVMPLIGAIDAPRVDRIMQTLLSGVSSSRARVAIVDITGVTEINASVADAVVGAARAVQLLGARVVLTGIRPEVAQTLVTLDADLRGIATLGTLESGIAFAMLSAS